MLVLLWIFFCVVSGMYAHYHCNRSGIGWFFVAFLFSPLVAFVLLLVLPSRPEQPSQLITPSGAVVPYDYTPRHDPNYSRMVASVFVVAALLVTLFMLVIHSASAQQQSFRDSSGRSIGTAATSGNQTTFRDASGRNTGTATTSPSGVTVLRDASGRTTGTIQLERKIK